MTMGENIRNIRRHLNLSQQQVAIRLNITQGAISQWEKDKTHPTHDQLIALTKLFRVSINDIMGMDGPEEEIPESTQKESPLDEKLVNMLMDLPPDQVQLVMAFVSGLRASQSPASSPHPSESEPRP